MKIGIDAKRIFLNDTGLGVYGRNLVNGISALNSNHSFVLYTPKATDHLLDKSKLSNQFFIKIAHAAFHYFWRTFSIKKDIQADQIELYHGLSNELPLGIERLGIKTIVDIHDLCYVRFPQGNSWIDRQIFWYKAKRAVNVSTKIIATSQATKADIIKYFKIPSEKIQVVYQCCDQIFYQDRTEIKKQAVKEKYKLPDCYILSVGTIQGRKNQKAIIEALALMPESKRLPLVLVGKGKKYLEELKALASVKNVTIKLASGVNFQDLPAIYQGANLFIYPSLVEGFGIPVLEAMASKIPVITSKDTSMAEIIQDEENLVEPRNVSALSQKILSFLEKDNSANIARAYKRSQEFSQERFAKQILEIYENL